MSKKEGWVIRAKCSELYLHVLPKELGDYELVDVKKATTYDSERKAIAALRNLKESAVGFYTGLYVIEPLKDLRR